MKKKYILIILLASAVFLSSCKKWLEIQPKSEMAAEVLFETPEGFSIALNGIYTTLSEPALHGQELKYAFVDVLARQYDTRNSFYDDLKEYNYGVNHIRSIIDNIW